MAPRANRSNSPPPDAALDYERMPSGMIIASRDKKLIMRNIEAGLSTLLVGPSGCGKTRLAIEIAQEMDRDYEVFHFGGIQADHEATFQGTTQLRDGETRFLKSRLAETIELPRRVLVMDEVNRAPGLVQNALLSLCDFQRRAPLEIGDEHHARTIELHPENAIVATANVGAEYFHTEPLDPALVGRMLVIRLDYPPGERDLLSDLGLDKTHCDDVIRVTRAVRAENAKQTIGSTVTTRALIEIGKMIRDRFDLGHAFEANVGVTSADELAALRTIVRTTRKT